MGYIKKLKATFMRKRVDDDLLGIPVESAEHAYRLFKDMENEAKEKLVCLHLTENYEIISFEVVAIGTEKYLLAEPQEIIRSAALIRAKRIVLLHNHPPGSPEPSASDIKAATELKRVAEAMKIVLQDMIIIGDGGYTSLASRGHI
ncbi:JAB domain-containing protein [Thiohalomonas denitrificans]|uniref:JAB domain-containing protein n=1 Tax=Thiohalomonas denitrificans TaxID=415747 RepID=UPI0026F2A0F7|nr:JAB domain-containing protein [Thiohalomonas denitrificans]